ncbi:hypothetical protein E4L98_29315 [Duganella callida]|uniref:GPI inositol-deacylase PGAP1-like alpha/beta domain-containing protein n=2 Tax=Duganella callida TaxID=2561932 RepID=A0A4Y9RVZ8_9BURK|nr:hypothetical protein E4L98_29315 [Duganella callida]
MSVAPKRVLPIVFLPGIMGSSLRMSAARQAELKKSNNIAWKPDSGFDALKMVNATPAQRQLQLDPDTTEVDIYDPHTNPTGDPKETADGRHNLGFINVELNVGIDTPLLKSDPKKSKEVKARERGWGEVYFSSYRSILEICEEALNQYWTTGPWVSAIIGREPKIWGASPEFMLPILTEQQHKKAVAGCWFPVHAMGYNWLKSNAQSAKVIASRISALICKYQNEGYQCEKIIVVTHSMGGLVARALIHPDIGGMKDEILGIVHGVMPAAGAPAAYKRMRCGFEEAYGGIHPAPKVLGNYGAEVTAVLANAPGGLELLPSKAYGNEWLVIAQGDKSLLKLPQKGNPYSEIYKLPDKWYGLLREEWINPARLEGRGFSKTCELLDLAENFHDTIRDSYHPLSYAHYGADSSRPSWEKVVWNLEKNQKTDGWQNFHIILDSGKGRLQIFKSETAPNIDIGFSIDGVESAQLTPHGAVDVSLGPSNGPGDQTVPMRSADAQLFSKKFAGIFRQIGYEHQGSYDDKNAVRSTLYSLSKIISTMRWSDDT